MRIHFYRLINKRRQIETEVGAGEVPPEEKKLISDKKNWQIIWKVQRRAINLQPIQVIITIKKKKDMGTLKLIDDYNIFHLNKAEKATLAQTYKALVEEGTTSSTPDQPSVQSGEEGYQKLNIPEELWNRFCTAEEYMSDMTMQSTASEETPEMQAIAAKREKLVQVCVRRVLESEDMPIEDEQEAAKKLKIVVSPYKGIYKKTVKEKISIVNGFLKDIKKEEYAEYVTTLKLDGYIAEIEQLHNQYCTLKKQRSSRQAEKPDDMTVEAQSKILQDALDDMNAYANATSLLEPSEETTKFILEVRNLFDETRAARNMRDSKRDDDETDEGEGDEPTEETPGEPTEETPGGDDDRPVVQ